MFSLRLAAYQDFMWSYKTRKTTVSKTHSDAREIKKIPNLFCIECVHALGVFSVYWCGMLNISTKSPEARAREAVWGLVLPLSLQKPTVFAIQLHIKENAVKKSNQTEPVKLCTISEL